MVLSRAKVEERVLLQLSKAAVQVVGVRFMRIAAPDERRCNWRGSEDGSFRCRARKAVWVVTSEWIEGFGTLNASAWKTKPPIFNLLQFLSQTDNAPDQIGLVEFLCAIRIEREFDVPDRIPVVFEFLGWCWYPLHVSIRRVVGVIPVKGVCGKLELFFFVCQC